MGNMARFQEGVGDAIHGGGGNGNRPEARGAPTQVRRSLATRLTVASAATGPLARVRPTTSARLPGLIAAASLDSETGDTASAHLRTARSVDASRPASVAPATRPSGSVT